MNCFDTICVPFVYGFRCMVYCLPCCFRQRFVSLHPFDTQLQQNKCKLGGWYSDYYRNRINTRDTFYTLLGLRFRHKDAEDVALYVQRLCQHMNAEGQVPIEFVYSWGQWSPKFATYGKTNVDANLYFIIMAWWCNETHPNVIRKYYLYIQRAYEWLNTFVCDNTFYEPIGASWEWTRHHRGCLTLTNVLMTQAIRSMELIACLIGDTRQQALFRDKHDSFKAKRVADIYKTQETLPRILAIHWNMVPDDFLQSFEQEMQTNYVPLRTDGPIPYESTARARIYGQSDLHSTVVWPFVGFLWISILAKRHKMDIARSWWASYIEMHHAHTIYDIYSGNTGIPIRRAFLKAMPAHSATLSLQMAAKQALQGVPV